MVAQNPSQYVDFSVPNNSRPKEGERTIPLFLDFTAQNSYAIDFTYIQQQKKLSVVQTLFIDNSQNPSPIEISFGTTQQNIWLPPNSQGYIPVLSSGEPKVIISTTGAIVINIQLLNFPVGAAVWYTTQQAGAISGSGGTAAQLVKDQVLEAAVQGGFYQSQTFITASGGIVKPNWKGDKSFSLITSAVGPTVIIAAQGAATGWFVSDINVSLSGNAVQAVAGDLTVTLTDTGTGTVFSKTVYVPAASANIFGDVSLFNFDGLGYNAKSGNNTFTITLSAALTTGHVNVNGTWGNTTIIT